MKIRKILDWIFILSFVAILLIPSIFFNFEKDQISEIDNRKFTELQPFQELNWTSLDGLFDNLKAYHNDRLGLRSQLITLHQKFNDKLFHVLEQNSYEYGKADYVFLKFEREWRENQEFVDKYTNYIGQMQLYCEARNIPFLFALNPSKNMLYKDFLPDGIHYQFDLYKDLVNMLDEKAINYIDLAVPLTKAKENGIPVCNVKYDAGHWNMHGAFYGMSAIMERMTQRIPTLSPINPDDFNLIYRTEKTLPVTHFSINEDCPHYILKNDDSVLFTDYFDDLRKSKDYPYYVHFKNPKNPDGPKLFVFHGSHLGGEPQRYITNQFSEVVYLYSYHIIADLPYYINIFQPDIVLYEVADRTVNSGFIHISTFENKIMPPALSQFSKLPEAEHYFIEDTIAAENNTNNAKFLKQYTFQVKGSDLKYAYLKKGRRVLDFDIVMESDGLYTLSVVAEQTWFKKAEDTSIVLIPQDMLSKQTISVSTE